MVLYSFAVVMSVAADDFTIDRNLSSLTISGSVLGAAFTPQGAGSLTTKYGGTIKATQTGGTIQFTGASLITALTNGNWQPLAGGANGNAPANYGASATPLGFTSVKAAMRSMLFDVTSPAVTVTGSQFDPSSLTFILPVTATSALDYRDTTGFIPAGSKLLSGNATNNVATLASLTTAGNVQTLSLQVNATFYFTVASANDTVVTITGPLVATHTNVAAVVPVVIQTPLVTNNVVTLKWQSPTGQVFQVQSSTNLQAWLTNASNITSATTNYSWIGTNPASKGFYRLSR